MKRRQFIRLLGGAAAMWSRTVMAQQPNRFRRIGVLMELAADDPQARANIAAFQRGLHTLGWLEGSNLTVVTAGLLTMRSLYGSSPKSWSSCAQS
jgi:putative tryptophan/tyrosine transport system substrate-binding protein